MNRTDPPLGESWSVAPALGMTGLALILGSFAAVRHDAPTAVALPPPPARPPPVVVVVPPPPPAPPAPAPVVDCGPVLYFHYEAGAAAPRSRPVEGMDALREFLERHPEAQVVVDGHADATGSVARNLALSHARATAAATWLESQGVPAKRVTARGFGAYQPLPGHEADADRNRRVRVGVSGVAGCSTGEGP